MTLLTTYLVTFVIFLGLDYICLSYLIKPTFERYIGPLLLESPRIGPAFLFYAFYVAVVIYFVSAPALSEDRSLLWVFATAALMGAFAYGTYEFTNLATLKNWTWTMVATDLTWGTLLTAHIRNRRRIGGADCLRLARPAGPPRRTGRQTT